jgi:hypothetical protein
MDFFSPNLYDNCFPRHPDFQPLTESHVWTHHHGHGDVALKTMIAPQAGKGVVRVDEVFDDAGADYYPNIDVDGGNGHYYNS